MARPPTAGYLTIATCKSKRRSEKTSSAWVVPGQRSSRAPQHAAHLVDAHRLIGNDDGKDGAPPHAFHEFDRAAMQAHQLVRNGKPQAGATALRGAAKGGEEVLPRLLGKAGSGIADGNPHHGTGTCRGDGKAAHDGS